MIDTLQQYNKFWTALAIVIALYVINNLNLGLTPDLVTVVSKFLIAALPAGVYFAPNKSQVKPVGPQDLARLQEQLDRELDAIEAKEPG